MDKEKGRKEKYTKLVTCTYPGHKQSLPEAVTVGADWLFSQSIAGDNGNDNDNIDNIPQQVWY